MNAPEINGFVVNTLDYENVDYSHLRSNVIAALVDKSSITLVVCLASTNKLNVS